MSKPITYGKTRLCKGSNPLPPEGPRPPPPPNPPLSRLIRESDAGPYCPSCGSSLERLVSKIKRLSRTEFCINPECDNYFSGLSDTTKERLKRLCDDLDNEARETEPYHTTVRKTIGIISNAIRKEFKL